jgi:hypothetical protein
MQVSRSMGLLTTYISPNWCQREGKEKEEVKSKGSADSHWHHSYLYHGYLNFFKMKFPCLLGQDNNIFLGGLL